MPNYTILVCVHNENGSKTIHEAVETLGSGVDSCVYKLGNQTYSSIQYYCKVNRPQPSKENKYLVFHSQQPIPRNSAIKIISPIQRENIGFENPDKGESDDTTSLSSGSQLIASTQTRFRLQQQTSKFLHNSLQEQYEKELVAIDREANLTRYCSNSFDSDHSYTQVLKSAPSVKYKITDNAKISYLIEFNIAMILPYIDGVPLYSGENNPKVNLEKYLARSMASLEEINRLHYVCNTIHGDIHGNNILIKTDVDGMTVKAYAIDVARAALVGENFYKYHLTCKQKHRYTTSDRQTHILDLTNEPVPAKFRHDLFALVTTLLDFFQPKVDATGSLTTSIDLSGNNAIKSWLNQVVFEFLKTQLQNLAKLYDNHNRDFNDYRPIQQLLNTASFLLKNIQCLDEVEQLDSALQSPWIMDYLSYTLIGPVTNPDLSTITATLDCFSLFSTRQLEQLNNFYIDCYQTICHEHPQIDFLSQCIQSIQQIYKQDPQTAQLLAQCFERIEELLDTLKKLEFKKLCSSARPATEIRTIISNIYTCFKKVIVALPTNIVENNIKNIVEALEIISKEINKEEQNIQTEIKHQIEYESPDAILFFGDIDDDEDLTPDTDELSESSESLVLDKHLITGTSGSFYQQSKNIATTHNASTTLEQAHNLP